MFSYQDLIHQPTLAPAEWQFASTHSEPTVHQLSPYIGKLKSSIARDLVAEYSRKGDLVVDPFCGSGTVPLECLRAGRRVFAADAGLYAVTLTRGKLFSPKSFEEAFVELDRALVAAESCPVDLRRVPKWVRDFYHPKTLKETLSLVTILRNRRHYFLLACLLGIAHHQRPGFLSFPSSHLVPYLRSKKFPRETYPEMYEYRSVLPRMRAKIQRALDRKFQIERNLIVGVRRSTIEALTPPPRVNCFITSPPYMNALDYGRDNRLRNWFLTGDGQQQVDLRLSGVAGFRRVIESYARVVEKTLVRGGKCVLVVGEKTQRKGQRFPSETLSEIFDLHAPSLSIKEIISDKIPDIRRSRRNLTGVKLEHILVYERAR